MGQGVIITVYSVIAMASWLLVARAVRLRRAAAADLFVSVGVVIALWTTASLVQAQVVEEIGLRIALLRFQLALGSLGPALWLVTLLRVAAPDRIRSLQVALIATPALVFGGSLLASAEGGPWLRAITANIDAVRPVLVVDPGPWLWWGSLPYTYALLIAAIVVVVRTPRVRRGFGRHAPWVLLGATAAPLIASILVTSGNHPLPGYDAVGLGLGVSVLILHGMLGTTAIFAPREHAFRAAFDAMHEAALVVATDGTVLEANPAAARLLGDGDRWRGANLTAAAPQLELARRNTALGALRRPLSGDFTGFEMSLAHTAPRGAAHQASLLILHDRRQDRAREAQLLELTKRDALTEVANRLGFESALERALAQRRGRPVGLAYLDLDGFKAVNDTFGHAAGDAVLVECARRLTAIVRDGDVVARLGGDEFALILPDVTPEALSAVAERVVSALNASIATDAGPVAIGASVGLAVAPHDGTDMDRLLRVADARMYREKRAKPDPRPRSDP